MYCRAVQSTQFWPILVLIVSQVLEALMLVGKYWIYYFQQRNEQCVLVVLSRLPLSKFFRIIVYVCCSILIMFIIKCMQVELDKQPKQRHQWIFILNYKSKRQWCGNQPYWNRQVIAYVNLYWWIGSGMVLTKEGQKR